MAYYDFREKPNPNKDSNEKKKYYVRAISRDSISAKEFFQRASEGSTFRPGELEGALMEMVDAAALLIKLGSQVEFGELGFFSGKIKARVVENKKELRGTSVKYTSVNFLPSKKFREKTSGNLTRNPRLRFSHSKERSDNELETILVTYLKEHGMIRRVEYSKITGRLKNLALADLRRFEKKGVIFCIGTGNQMYFKLVEDVVG